MTKRFDVMHEQQKLHYMYLKTLTSVEWVVSPPVPAPLALLSLPYYMGSMMGSALQSCFKWCTERKGKESDTHPYDNISVDDACKSSDKTGDQTTPEDGVLKDPGLKIPRLSKLRERMFQRAQNGCPSTMKRA